MILWFPVGDVALKSDSKPLDSSPCNDKTGLHPNPNPNPNPNPVFQAADGENLEILAWTVFAWSTRVTDR